MSNTAIFFKGSTTDLIYKNEYSYSDFKYSEDLTKRSTSSFNIMQNSVDINELDIVWLMYKGLEVCGRVNKVSNFTNYSTVDIFIGHDSFDFDINMPENKILNPNLSESYYTPLTVSTNVTGLVSTSDGDLTYDTLIRQAMRQECRMRTMGLTPAEDAVYVSIIDYEEKMYKLDLNDNNLSNVYYEFSTDGFNTLRLKKDGKYKDYYYTYSGTVSDNVKDAIFPLLQKVEKIEEGSTEITDADFALSRFKSQEYNHIVEFNYDIDNTSIECLNFDETILGRNVTIYIQEYDKEFKSIISSVSIEGDVMSIKLGLSRIRFTEKINGDIN